jgi:hypothetical protein
MGKKPVAPGIEIRMKRLADDYRNAPAKNERGPARELVQHVETEDQRERRLDVHFAENKAAIELSAFERGYKVGKGLRPSDARPFAEGLDGRQPRALLGVAAARYDNAELIEWERGFVAGFQEAGRTNG